MSYVQLFITIFFTVIPAIVALFKIRALSADVTDRIDEFSDIAFKIALQQGAKSGADAGRVAAEQTVNDVLSQKALHDQSYKLDQTHDEVDIDRH